MSKAYICDKCGKIQPNPMMSVWTVDPNILNDDRFAFDLCSDCYEEFNRDYLENLHENGGV